jgi:hypothetical protein
MPARIRKLIGAVALLTLVCVWALLAMALAQSVLTDINGFGSAGCYRQCRSSAGCLSRIALRFCV